jgi:multidrug efflux pump subunit AcrB
MKGMIEWFARNSVAANLLMIAIFLGGAFTLRTIPLEIFPDFQLDQINIRMQYRGATPAEVEESVVIRIEEAVQDLDGIKQITSRASEGSGSVQVEVAGGFDPRELLEDIKNRVDAISTFPDETERPLINVAQRRWGRDVVEVIVAGDMPEGELKRLGERVHDEIVNLPGVSPG